MLNQGIKHLLFVVFISIVACTKNDKRDEKIVEISRLTIGYNEYDSVYKQAVDSLKAWDQAKLSGYQSVWSYTYQLDSTLCFNLKKDRMITTILIQCDQPNCQQENVEYFYGAKIKGKWYFFRGGGTMVVLRKNHQSDIHTPLSFAKLHEIAMKNIFRGYLKKNLKDEWEINDAFFTSRLEGVGWGDFNKQSHEDTVAYGKRFTNKKEYFENIYWDVVKSYWTNPEKKSTKSQE